MTAIETTVERLLLLLPGSRVDRLADVARLEIGGGDGIVALVTPEAIELRLPTVDWVGSHDPVPSSRLWRRIKTAELTDEELSGWVSRALAARAREFRECRFCKAKVPPEHRHSKNVCHGCAERHLGVVH
jgi:hypothetical protein